MIGHETVNGGVGVREWGSTGVKKQPSAIPRKLVTKHQELDVYRRGFEAAMGIFTHTKRFPKEETYSLTDQIRRSSRSVCANIAEAWRKRRYPAAFVSTLNLAEAEAAETQTWIEFAVRCKYLDRDAGAALYQEYDSILGMLVSMIQSADTWKPQ